MTIHGKLTTITEKQYVIESDRSIYYLHRDAVPEAEKSKFDHPEKDITVTLPMAAIDTVKTKKTAAAH